MHAPSALLLPFLLALSCGAEPPLPSSSPPTPKAIAEAPVKANMPVETRKVDVVDDYHGVQVTDPYRWLEESDSADVKAWTDAENAVTRRFLDAIPGREKLAGQVRDLLEVGLVSAPEVRDVRPGLRRYFHTKREGAENQPILYVREGAFGDDRVLIDPCTLSADATSALDWWHPSNDGALLAWGHSDAGSEESTLQIRDVAKGTDLDDRIPYTRYASVAWLPGNKGFYYTRFPDPGTVPHRDEKYFCKVFLHLVGQGYKGDALVFGEGREKTDLPQVSISPDGRWLVVRVHEGLGQERGLSSRNLSLGDQGPWIPVATGEGALFEPIVRNERLYLQTNLNAPKFRLVAVDYLKPDRAHWTEIVREGADVIDDVTMIGRELFVTYLHDASTRIERVSLDGNSGQARHVAQVALPSLGSAAVAGAWNGDEAFLSFTSFVDPPQVMRLDLTRAGAPSMWDRVGVGFSANGVSVSRMYATSKDGTRIPMFVVAKEGTPRDGTSPTVLYGYGGFNVNMTPAFSARALLTVERGGVWVTAILRGGGELGEAWHRAGMLANKQNVFDDAIACAEELVAEKVTSPLHLAVMGGSNGGLLVAALVTQRPDLFRVGLSLVPLTDMLRYERFRIAKLWASEYGSVSDEAQFKVLYAYSPYHHVKDGATYPSMLFTTAESDSRVDPMHARKMAARMQAAQGASERPILLRVESRAGHGQGKPVSKLVEEMADELSFMFCELGVAL
jgi:prolyl oligopeptidase